MYFPFKARLIITSLCVTASVYASETNPLPFAEAQITQVVNQVSIIESASLTKADATIDQTFQAPDILETGRRSRAELVAEDGTITRVGSNTLFSFEPTKREINLKRGSVLFHSPSGMGGGQIVTDAATASVVGTTIIVAATTDGGFKILCLEGRARVQFADGSEIFLNAGQLTFVLPAVQQASNDLPDVGDLKGGQPGPILNFDLKRMASRSFLLRGFTMKLASQDKIKTETTLQQNKIANGELGETNTVILGAKGKYEVILANGAVVENAIEVSKLLRKESRSEASALFSDVTLTGSNQASIGKHLFPDQTTITSTENAFLGNSSSAFGNTYQGVIARNITFDTDQFDLSSLGLNIANIDFAASNEILFNTNSMLFYGTAGIDRVRITAPSISFDQISFDQGSVDLNPYNSESISIGGGNSELILLAESKTAFVIDMLGESPMVIDDTSFYNTFGPLELLVREGDVEFNNAVFKTSNSGDISILDNYNSTDLPVTETPSSLLPPTDPADITLTGSENIQITNSTFQAYNSSVRIGEVESNNSPTPKQILMEGSNAYANRLKLIAQDQIDFNNNYIDAANTKLSADNLTMSGNTFYLLDTSAMTVSLELNALDTIEFANNTLTSLTDISMSAATINVSDTHFNAGTTVHFKTTLGMLYLVQTNEKMLGHVNFKNVTYGSDFIDAYQYVHEDSIVNAPTGYVNTLGTPITVSTLNSINEL